MGLRRSLLLGLAVLVLLPATVVGYQLVQVADERGCPSRLVAAEGPLRLRLYLDDPAQAGSLDPHALAAYLGDRAGRPFEVTGLEVTDATGFRLAAAARPFSQEILVFLAAQPSFPNVQTAHGMVDALGFATPGTACAYVSFIPVRDPPVCRLASGPAPVQPAYAYLAHEAGHLLGLSHTKDGIMGRGVFQVCSGDTFSASQVAHLRAWGRA